MPSGKAHDAITVLLAIPIFVVSFLITQNLTLSFVIAVFSLIGGLVFGPDLDTTSSNYSRWGIFRIIWFPYRIFFKHRSRFTHGIIFGTLLRTIYLMGMLTLIVFLLTCAVAVYRNNALPDLMLLTQEWQRFGELISTYLGPNFALLIFIGLWLGGLAHSLTDIAGTYVKTGKLKALL